MKNLQLNGISRPDFGKKAAKAIRKEGNVPCVLYGGEEVIHFLLPENDTNAFIYTPDIFTMELNIDGKKYMSILKDSQFHPVKDNVLHLDFLQIFEEKPIIMEVPVHLNGLAQGVKDGGKLSQELRKLKVKGLYKNIPDVLNIDVTDLGLGKTMQVGVLSFENIEIISAKQAIVCAVKLTRVARGLAAAAAKEDGKK
ncbi:MAG: 50S ribosomal protein L25/general stress protein Ctc [Bacteroidales bacterium]|nr:50S ribosomal protein L25/general stress protein Ctc [Bacteroidales bacterium]